MRASRFYSSLLGIALLAGATLTFLPASPARAALEPYAWDVTITSAPSVFDPSGFAVRGTVMTKVTKLPVPGSVGVKPSTYPSQVPSDVPSTVPSQVPSSVEVPPSVPRQVNSTGVPKASVRVRLASTPPIDVFAETNNDGTFTASFTPAALSQTSGAGLALIQVFASENATVAYEGVTVVQPAAQASPSPTVAPSGGPTTTVGKTNESLMGSAFSLMRFPTAASGLINQLSSGALHNCVLLADETARCWGLNSAGQLGDATTINRGSPRAVSGIDRISTLATGGEHTCAIHTVTVDDTAIPGRVSCWGSNASGQLGNSTIITSSKAPVSVEFSEADAAIGAVDIATGWAHTCALLANTTVRCWGSNISGQAGADLSTSIVATPTELLASSTGPGISGVTQLTAGGLHTCGRRATTSLAGQVICWGANYAGQLGDESTADSNWPVLTKLDGTSLVNTASVVAGFAHTCARTSTSLACWGDNSSAQQGTASPAMRDQAAVVAQLTAVSGVTAGGFHTCAIETKKVVCAGSNAYAQLGDDTTTDRSSFVDVKGLTGLEPETIGAGLAHGCTLTTTRAVLCWGSNEFGQIGDGSDFSLPANQRRLRATAVAGLESVTSITAGSAHTCAVSSTNKVRCWGDNAKGQLGNGTILDKVVPTLVPGMVAASLTAGDAHTCALGSDASIRCWGDNAKGQLGDGTVVAKSTPTVITGQTAREVVAGAAHTCSIFDAGALGTADDSVRCWGANALGQVGDNTTVDKLTPTSLAAMTNVTQIAAGGEHTCALFNNATPSLADDFVRCWGSNKFGQIGDGYPVDLRKTPIRVPGLVGVVQIAAGRNHTCARLENGNARCWGANDEGQLGNGTQIGSSIPVSTTMPIDPRALVAGGRSTCVIVGESTPETTDDTASCWGSNSNGQLGDGTTARKVTPPSPISLLGVRRIAVGATHTCAVLSNGTARCWGANGKGQVGDNTTEDRWTPVSISI